MTPGRPTAGTTTTDAVAGACGIGVMRVVPGLAEEPVDESDITFGEQVGAKRSRLDDSRRNNQPI